MPDAPPAPSPEPSAPGTDLAAAATAVDQAAARVRDTLARAADTATGEAADILAVTAAMAADPSLADEARRRVVETRSTPARAVWDAAELVAEQLRALGGMFADRARDVQDVRDRIIAELLGLRRARRPGPRAPVRAGGAGSRPRRHRTAGPRARPGDRHGRRRADGPHRDPGAVAGHPVRRRGGGGARHRRRRDRARRRVDRRRRPAPVRPTPVERAAHVAPAPDPAGAPRTHRRRPPRRAAGQRRRPRRGRRRGGDRAPRASGCSAPSSGSSAGPPRRASPSRSRPTRRCSTRSPAGAS